MQKIRIVTAPVRVDIAGGWTDAGPFIRDHGGAVLNFAINIRVQATFLRMLTIDPGQVDQYSGLGTSGAMRAAEVAACNPTLSKSEIVESVYKLENDVMRHSAGYQDQAAAVHGGVALYEFDRDGTYVRHDASVHAEWIENHIVLVSTQEPHSSGNIHDQVFWPANYLKVHPNLVRIKAAAQSAFKALGDLNDFANAVQANWASQRALHKSTTSPKTDELEAHYRGDCLAMKALGAGGGGVLMFVVENAADFRNKVLEDGEHVVDYEVDLRGLEVSYQERLASFP